MQTSTSSEIGTCRVILSIAFMLVVSTRGQYASDLYLAFGRIYIYMYHIHISYTYTDTYTYTYTYTYTNIYVLEPLLAQVSLKLHLSQ